jgi:hypothetical protein
MDQPSRSALSVDPIGSVPYASSNDQKAISRLNRNSERIPRRLRRGVFKSAVRDSPDQR